MFKGIAEFATAAPEIITGDNYEMMASTLVRPNSSLQSKHLQHFEDQFRSARRQVATHQAAVRVHRRELFRLSGGTDDLVLLMDESHRYRASAGVRAINELKPVLGLELTATPFVETSKGPVPFKNVDIRLSAWPGDGGRIR